MKAIAQAMGGRYVPSSLRPGSRRVLTIFPLGGCPMGASSSEGVVDPHGRVFKSNSGGGAVHPGLYVTDGAVIPSALAVQPTLTIVALALRAASVFP